LSLTPKPPITVLARTILAALGAIFLGAVLFVGFYDLHDFRPYAGRIEAVYESMEPEDRQPPPNVQRFIWKVDGHIVDTFAASRLLSEMRGQMNMGSWHYHSLMWDLMLHFHFDKQQRLALYCHYLPHENGVGFSAAARACFGKQPHELADEQLATLVAIGRSPGANSTTRHPEHLERIKLRLLEASKSQ